MPLTGNEQKQRDQLVRKRGAIKSRLTAFKTFLQQAEQDPDIHALKAHLERVGNAFAALDEYTNDLQGLEPEIDHYAEQAIMEEEYTKLLAKCYKLQDKATRIAAAASTSSDNSRLSPSPFMSHQPLVTRLPEQPLPKFSGKYEDWLSFQDEFQSSIGRRPGLSDTEKLKYLRSCLSGEPWRLVKQFETTDEGYQSAWSLLKKMFEDKGRIRERHVSEILSIPTMQRESAASLSELINTLELHNSALKSLSENTYSTLMLCITLSKLDKATRKQWKMSQRDDELPTYEKLIEFLRRMVISSDEPLFSSKEERANGHGKGRNGSLHNQPDKGPKQARSFVTTTGNECPMCKAQHTLFQCPEFKKLPPKERFQAATRASVCINCLRTGHSTKQCTSSFSCKTCRKRHHSWLHFAESSPSACENNENVQQSTSQS